jgi:predicted NBD/HSP70 family sugar kinase/biotin operon repressor
MGALPPAPLASLDLLRRITDQHVLEQLLAAKTLTRAELAATTGISKPTISESVRRLEEAGLVSESGQQVGRRGRAGTYYALRSGLGCALAIGVGPEGLLAQTRDLRGELVGQLEQPTPSPVTESRLNPLLDDLVTTAVRAAPGPVLGSAMSVAGPIDRVTGRLVQLPDSPFLVDELRPRELLAGLLGPGLEVDNDVNWAALAEYHEGSAAELDDFCYCHLGHGLGGALVWQGEVVRGSRGLAGEIAHVRTSGPRGRSMRLIEGFAVWGLLQRGSAAIDVPKLCAVLEGRTVADRRVRDGVVVAVSTAIASMIALLNPSAVVIGGPWSNAADFSARLQERVQEIAVVATTVRPALLGSDAPLTGARIAAVRSAQRRLLNSTVPPTS